MHWAHGRADRARLFCLDDASAVIADLAVRIGLSWKASCGIAFRLMRRRACHGRPSLNAERPQDSVKIVEARTFFCIRKHEIKSMFE